MKKLLLLVLSAMLLLAMASCAGSKTVTPDELTEPAEGSVDPENVYIAAGMPIPGQSVVDGGGEDNSAFIEPYDYKLSLHGVMIEDFVNYLGITVDDFYASIERRFVDGWSQRKSSNLLERENLLSLIIEFDIPNEVVAESLRKHNDLNEDLAVQYGDLAENPGNADMFRSRKFTDAEIDALLSRDTARVLEQFATEHTVVIGDRAYSPMWFYLHTPEDYASEGITSAMVEDKLDLYGDLYLTDEAFSAFEQKLSVFTGERVSLADRQTETDVMPDGDEIEEADVAPDGGEIEEAPADESESDAVDLDSIENEAISETDETDETAS